MSAISIDCATRTEELARDLAANFDRLTLARLIAREIMEPARAQSFGNLALKKARREGFDRVERFEREQDAAEAAAAAERRRARVKEETERKLKQALSDAEGGAAP